MAGMDAGRMQRSGPARIRTALFLGFGLLLALWIVAGYSVARSLTEVRARLTGVNIRFTAREQQLFTLRVGMLLGSVYLRDALLDTTPGSEEHYRTLLQHAHQAFSGILTERVAQATSAESQKNWTRLRDEMEGYWGNLLEVLSWDSRQRVKEGPAYLRRQVIPKRDLVMRISEQIQDFNRLAHQEQRAEVEELYRSLQERLWGTIGLGVLLSLGIALGVIRYAGNLERIIREQHLEAVDNKLALQRLSASLVRAQEEERRVISRELHDEIGQALTAVKLNLASVERGGREEAPPLDLIKEARAIADRTLNAVRDLSQTLHPAMLDQLGLADTLKWYLRGFSRRTSVRAELVQHDCEGRLAPEVEVAAYRIIQEGLTNVARHAQATRCSVTLRRLPESVVVTIEDDGVGFEANQREYGQGLGLIGIQERASELGGSLRLETGLGKGTRLWVEFPALPVPSPPDDLGEDSTAEESASPASAETE